MRTSHSYRNLIASLAVLVIALVVAGCGSDSSESPSPPPPVSGAGGAGSKAVIPATTEGLLGPAGKVTAGEDERVLQRPGGKIPANADKPTNSQKKGVAAAAQCADSEATPNEGNLGAMAQSVLCLVNAERADKGLGALTQNGQLDQAAQGMADEMVAKQFFSHETPDGKNLADRVEPTGYIPNSDDWVLGENLAWGSGALSTPRAIVNGWMNSEGHRKNILDGSYKEVGLGTKMGSPSPSAKGGTVFVHNFGAKGGGGASAASAGDGGSGDDAGSGGDPGAGDNPAVAGTQSAAAVRRCKAKAKKAKSAAKRRAASRRCGRRR